MNKIITLSNEHSCEILRVPLPFLKLRLTSYEFSTSFPYSQPTFYCIWRIPNTRKKLMFLINYGSTARTDSSEKKRSYNLLNVHPRFQHLLPPMNKIYFRLGKPMLSNTDNLNISLEFELFEYG